MKKKGLIISTAVMVVVLIAALTTSTFAWFSQQATVEVSQMSMTTKAATGLMIGARANNGNVKQLATYVYGEDLDFVDGYWQGGTGGLGGVVSIVDTIAFGNIQHATTKATNDIAVTNKETNGLKDTDVKQGDLVTAVTYDSESDVNNPTPLTFKKSKANEDYIDLELGIAATSNTIKQIYFTITVVFKMNETAQSIIDGLKPGMAAAINFELTYGSSPKTETVNAFSGRVLGTTFTGTDDQGKTQEETWTWTYSGFIYNDSTAITAMDIQTMHIRAWVEGTDDACRTSTAGTGGEISITFNYNETQDGTITKGVYSTAGD